MDRSRSILEKEGMKITRSLCGQILEFWRLLCVPGRKRIKKGLGSGNPVISRAFDAL